MTSRKMEKTCTPDIDLGQAQKNPKFTAFRSKHTVSYNNNLGSYVLVVQKIPELHLHVVTLEKEAIQFCRCNGTEGNFACFMQQNISLSFITSPSLWCTSA